MHYLIQILVFPLMPSLEAQFSPQGSICCDLPVLNYKAEVKWSLLQEESEQETYSASQLSLLSCWDANCPFQRSTPPNLFYDFYFYVVPANYKFHIIAVCNLKCKLYHDNLVIWLFPTHLYNHFPMLTSASQYLWVHHYFSHCLYVVPSPNFICSVVVI